MKFNLSLTLLFFVLSSCALLKREIDVRDFKKDATENLTSVNRGLGIIGPDLAGLSAVLSKWSDAESKSKFSKLKQSYQNIQQYYIRTKEDFQRLKFLSREKVSSEDKAYEQIKRERDVFQDRLKTLDNQLDSYKRDRNSLTDYFETKGIYRVNSQIINSEFIEALNELKKDQLDVKNKLMDYNVKFGQTTASPEETKEKKAIIQELVKIVEKIENQTFSLQRQHSSLAKEIGKTSVFVTPGMKAFGYKDRIKLHKETVEKYVSEFEEMAKKLK